MALKVTTPYDYQGGSGSKSSDR